MIIKVYEDYVSMLKLENNLEAAELEIPSYFNELKSQIKIWFKDGSLAAQGCKIMDSTAPNEGFDIYNSPNYYFLNFKFTESKDESQEKENNDKSTTDETESTTEVGSDDDNNFFIYSVSFQIGINKMKVTPPEDETTTEKTLDIDKVLLKINRFDKNYIKNGELIEEVNSTDIKENFFIDKIGQLDDKTDNKDVDGNDLNDDIYTT